ncbi:hypothetical protein SAMN02745163_00139 [Clostridium cavendishii DSM 21758]|uniref:Uncharacterized protein n=1 Tax=Clostridium cavendishii DSM 21758 TaxID=1121302 RepID=A0A1M6AP92_9CLOT|nr:hypothetical protein [Clostridium cavendishii]SHI38251.1 hypothetical protein SAMN02745163_00139 [Clostridium cavendishii DSM 21758]
MKKILYVIPIVFFIIFVAWGFIFINIENTRVFNDGIANQNIDYAKMKDLGVDFKLFTKDKSEIKIYHRTKNEFYMEVGRYEINFNESRFKKGLINFIDGFQYSLSKVGNIIGDGLKKIESII